MALYRPADRHINPWLPNRISAVIALAVGNNANNVSGLPCPDPTLIALGCVSITKEIDSGRCKINRKRVIANPIVFFNLTRFSNSVYCIYSIQQLFFLSL